MKIGGNYIDKEGKGGTVRYLPRSGLLEQSAARDGKQLGGFSKSLPRTRLIGNSRLVAPHVCRP